MWVDICIVSANVIVRRRPAHVLNVLPRTRPGRWDAAYCSSPSEGVAVEFQLLASLDPAVQRDVLASTTRRRYPKGTVLFHEGDPGDTLHLIAKGKVAVRVGTPEGDVATLTILGAGSAFGEQALLSGAARRTATVVAVEATETMALPRAAFEDIRSRFPSVNQLLLDQLAAQVRRLSTQLIEALYLSADKRVMRRIIELAHVFDGGDVPVTQEDVATMAGTTRPTVNRVMQTMESAGVIQLGRGRFRVLDAAALAAHAR